MTFGILPAPGEASATLEDLIERIVFLELNSCGAAPHGADDGYERPLGFAVVVWIGSVEPINAIDGDFWIDTTT